MKLHKIINICVNHRGPVGLYSPTSSGDFVITDKIEPEDVLMNEHKFLRCAQEHGIVLLSVDEPPTLPARVNGNSLPQPHILEFDHRPVSAGAGR